MTYKITLHYYISSLRLVSVTMYRPLLLTIDGKFHIQNLKIKKNYSKPNKHVKTINNFILFKIGNIAHIQIYVKAGIRLIIKNFQFHKRIDISQWFDILRTKLIPQLFSGKITSYTYKISQLVYRFEIKDDICNILTYHKIDLIFKHFLQINTYVIYYLGYTYYHDINFLLHENGLNSFHFKVLFNNKKIAYLRLYNNFKVVVTLVSSSNLKDTVNNISSFVRYIKNQSNK